MSEKIISNFSNNIEKEISNLESVEWLYAKIATDSVCDMTDEEIAKELRKHGLTDTNSKLETIFHDLGLCADLTMNDEDHDHIVKSDGIDNMKESANASTNVSKHETYVKNQTQYNETEKQLVADYAIDMLEKKQVIKDGDPIFIDAGSSPLSVWEALKKRNIYRYLTVHTCNFLIVSEWMENREKDVYLPKVQMMGGDLDREHGATYGKVLISEMTNSEFRPAVVFMGCTGIEFDSEKGIFYGYHGGDLEMEAKMSYFECHCRYRIILATPEKIGTARGQVFNILGLEKIDKSVITLLITTEPTNEEDKRNYLKSKKVFESVEFMELLDKAGINFLWYEVDSKTGEFKSQFVCGDHLGNLQPMNIEHSP